LVIAYASIGYFDTISRLLQLLVNNENYILEPIASAWQSNRIHNMKKRKKGANTKSKGNVINKKKRNSQGKLV